MNNNDLTQPELPLILFNHSTNYPANYVKARG